MIFGMLHRVSIVSITLSVSVVLAVSGTGGPGHISAEGDLCHNSSHPRKTILIRGQREFSIPGILDESQLLFFSLDHEK